VGKLHQVSTSVRNLDLVAQRRREIAEAAYAIFREKGFKSATVEEVAMRLGIDKATLYGYIERKEDLLYLLFQHYVPAMTRRLEKVAQSIQDPAARITALIDEQISIVSEEPDLVLLTYRELRHLHHEAIGSVLEMIRANRAPFETAIRDGVESGAFRHLEPTIAMQALVSMLYMLAPQAWDLERFGVDAVAQEVKRLFLRGVASEAPRR
jgi:TetR/AcrR family transcriptional regulator, cholesterol catabolism regulator